MQKLFFLVLICIAVETSAQTYTNGLSSTGSGGSTVVKLGGTLTGNTTIDLSTFTFGFKKSTVNFFTVLNNGHIGIGNITTPTSLLHLSAGTATAGTAPLKFSSGVLLTSAEQGSMEYNGSTLFFTPSSTRKEIAFADLSNISGTLGITNGGSGLSSISTGDILYGSGTNTLSKLAVGTTGQVLTITAGIPGWATPSSGGSGWTLSGNASTNTTTNFIGTTDNTGLVFRTNNTEKIRIDAAGNMGIGNIAPAFKLDVSGTGRFTGDLLINGITVGLGSGSVARNTMFGFQAGNVNTTGSDNSFIGYQAGLNNTTGSYNYVWGNEAGINNTTGNYNNFISYRAGYYNTTGNANNFIGYGAGLSNTNGSYNNFIGSNAGFANTSGNGNVFISRYSGLANTTGNYNSFIGYGSGTGNTTGSNNILLGGGAGSYITDGTTPATILNNSILIGNNTRPLADNQVNQIVIGNDAIGLGSNSTVLGNPSIVNTRIYGKLGLGTSAPDSALHIVGGFRLVNGTQAAGRVLTSDANGGATWQILPASGGGGVTSFIGRTGAVVAADNDYSFAQIGAKPTTLLGYGITDAAALTHTHALDALSNVTISAPANGQLLLYNTAAGKWINSTPNYLSSYTETDPIVKAINGIVKSNGTTISAAVAADFPTLNQNTTGTAGGLSANIAESQVNNLVTDLTGKQPTLVSGTNIKTLSGNSILGSGDLTFPDNTFANADLKFSNNRYHNAAGKQMTIDSLSSVNFLSDTLIVKPSGKTYGLAANLYTSSGVLWTGNALIFSDYTGIYPGYPAGNIYTMYSKYVTIGDALGGGPSFNFYIARPISVPDTNIIFDRRPAILANDTVQYGLYAGMNGTYTAKFNAFQSSFPATAKLYDSYLGTYTDISTNLGDTTSYTFTVSSGNPATTGKRLRMIFTPLLPWSTLNFPLDSLRNSPNPTQLVVIGKNNTLKRYPISLLSTSSGSGWVLSGNTGTNTANSFIGTTDNVGLSFRTNNTEKMFISTSGSVGIGTNLISDTAYKLFVETGIKTRKVKVDALAWADNVFDKNYKLSTLAEVEKFIASNKHLPDVPSEKEVLTNGIDVAETQKLLLQKVEELTLYIIDQEKQNKQQQEKIILQNKETANLQSQLTLMQQQMAEIKAVLKQRQPATLVKSKK